MESSNARTGFVAPTVAEVDTYCKEHNLNIDAKRFVDYYNARGWMMGNVPINNWQKRACSWAATERNTIGNCRFYNRLLEDHDI